ncbi:hypothetical protein TUBRATIS_25100 [Tubulinosema ratisbonensis]|uniref:Uncharacterized protein n=1 Tax=Tubulinosema ratisbonensis TaxID=291195 RepID=A0A437AIR3_9MICR|nr:hypothetical protein TUBRATIS_25100 [Tubulinosema ratisbonensis]
MVKKRIRLTMNRKNKLKIKQEKVNKLEINNLEKEISLEKENQTNIHTPKLDIINDKLINILKNEPEFNLQIITLMPLHEFTLYLKSNKIKFKILKNDSNLNEKTVYLFKEPIKVLGKKNILFNNKINFDFIPFYLHELKKENREMILENDKKFKESLLSLSYDEALVLMHTRKNKFNEISNGIVSYDIKFDNNFYILALLNSLIKKGYVKFNRNFYSWAVSKEILIFYAKKYDFPLEFVL